jgi:hypothetical protein
MGRFSDLWQRPGYHLLHFRRDLWLSRVELQQRALTSQLVGAQRKSRLNGAAGNTSEYKIYGPPFLVKDEQFYF